LYQVEVVQALGDLRDVLAYGLGLLAVDVGGVNGAGDEAVSDVRAV